MSYPCPKCPWILKSSGGQTQHINAVHCESADNIDNIEPEEHFTYQYHPNLTGLHCDHNGNFIPSDMPPPPFDAHTQSAENAWHPFDDRIEFDFANYHFTTAQSSAREINQALDIWAATMKKYHGTVPWKNATHLYATIDQIQHGSAPWKVYSIHYQGPLPAGTPPKWMTKKHELCTRDSWLVLHNQLAMWGTQSTY
ncbi:hypothetical protein JAAARDRAFT_191906 [Jaapia argillacea MUCL 33604]|uniref:C2H2-type domain-containing protein n=1 Tax=Jaapia argillacea MUCL 33604 TaxID=933084 RepID=A0A067Q0Q5_9AGAM|nr:hypothetical protein JAAARDRAFT_191906 [Jaapia argillacea MUCL 33604]